MPNDEDTDAGAKSFQLNSGAKDPPLLKWVPWAILFAFIAFCFFVLWIKG
ncbi:hypothetical protein BH10PLA1_BH10PLA1_20820 [soil metagenome]